MENDKPLVILAIVLLAAMGTYAGLQYSSPKEFVALLEFFKILSSGLFGLVTGLALGKMTATKKEKKDESRSNN